MKKRLFLFFLVLVAQVAAQSDTIKYFNHLIFRETPYSKTEGRIPITKDESKNTNHFKLTYDASNRLILIEYLYKNKLIELNRSGILDGKRGLASKTKIEYIGNEEIRTFFNSDGEPTTNGMGVFKEVYAYNKEGKRVSLRFYDKNDAPINNTWKIFEYKWKHIKTNTVLETRKDISGANVPMRPYYKFYNVVYKFNANGILLAMNNVDKNLNLINDETGIAIDKATYDENNNLISFQFFNAENKPVIGSFLGTAGGFATYDKKGNCLKYASIDLDGNYMLDKRSNDAYSRYKFGATGNLIERSSFDTDSKIQKKRGVTRVKYIYNQDDSAGLLKTEYHHTIPTAKIKDSVFINLASTIERKKLVADYNQLLITLKQHPTQFEFIDKVSYTNLVDAQREKLKDSMSINEFYQVVAPIVASLGCLHTRIVDNRFFSVPYKYWLPLIVWFEDGKMYAINNCIENIAMNVGSEIIEINGITAKDIYKSLKTTISADAFNERFYRGDLNINFLYYYHSYFGFSRTYKIKFKPYNTEKEITTTFFIDEPAPGYKSKIINTPRLSLDVKKEHKTAIIRIKNFSYFPRGKQNIDFFKEKIDVYMKKIIEENIEKVVLDLRGNRGGNPACTNHLLSYITGKEINFYEDNELNKRRNRPAIIKPKTDNTISNRNIFVITNGRSASATAQMLAVVKHNKLATILGEETGGTYSTHPGRRVKPLENTKLVLQIGTERESVNVPKLPLNKGIIPDKKIEIKMENILKDNDLVLDYIFNLK
ncbi:S41 family peptidase [uncultured Aquimarina sp.]|uniref:S41 family peptidase n=1 Tax=uncultured Aquimarina sp. TaxID=575652 RepID=UPI0026092FE8|nr:S41 family peptidase [uncultured Aquimarina sp.]